MNVPAADSFALPMTATCRHCGEPLSRIDVGWVDAAGFTVCVKAPADTVGRGMLAQFGVHEPMPAGLRGAPDA